MRRAVLKAMKKCCNGGTSLFLGLHSYVRHAVLSATRRWPLHLAGNRK